MRAISMKIYRNLSGTFTPIDMEHQGLYQIDIWFSKPNMRAPGTMRAISMKIYRNLSGTFTPIDMEHQGLYQIDTWFSKPNISVKLHLDERLREF